VTWLGRGGLVAEEQEQGRVLGNCGRKLLTAAVQSL